MTTAAETHRVTPIELGHGKTELEIFLEPTCPFSKRAFEKIDPLLAAVGEANLTIRIRFISQPWHLYSGVVTKAILAASTMPHGKQTALRAMAGVYANRMDFEFEDHCRGASMDRTPADIVRHISELAGVDLTEAFCFKNVDRALRWQVKYARQNGVHESPTFSIDGIVERNMSSGQSVEEWAEILRPHIHG